jgi:hypothetical protein
MVPERTQQAPRLPLMRGPSQLQTDTYRHIPANVLSGNEREDGLLAHVRVFVWGHTYTQVRMAIRTAVRGLTSSSVAPDGDGIALLG